MSIEKKNIHSAGTKPAGKFRKGGMIQLKGFTLSPKSSSLTPHKQLITTFHAISLPLFLRSL